jgi:hypothetical protein
MSIVIQQVEASMNTDRRQDGRSTTGMTVGPWVLKALPVAAIAAALAWAAVTGDQARPLDVAPAVKAVGVVARDLRGCEELFDEWLAKRGNDGDGSGVAEAAFSHCQQGKVGIGIEQLHRMLHPEDARLATKSP